jgi:hypothetical protein
MGSFFAAEHRSAISLVVAIMAMLVATLFQRAAGTAAATVLGLLLVGGWAVLNPDNDSAVKFLLVVLVLPAFSLLSGMSLAYSSAVCPFKYDHILEAIDCTLGFCPSFQLAHLVQGSWAGRVLQITYSGFVVAMLFCYGYSLSVRNGARALTAFVVNLGVGSLLYLIVPACGPQYAFGPKFSQVPFSGSLNTVMLNGDPNCMPSLHLSAALIVLFLCAKRRPHRTAAICFVLLTALATLSTGEHYLIDLIVAFPFALFVVSAVRLHWHMAVAAFATVLCWVLSIRWIPGRLIAHPILLWTLAATTVAFSFVLLLQWQDDSSGEEAPLRYAEPA